MYSSEIASGITWYDTVIPEWLRAFDCRSMVGYLGTVASYGFILYGSEKAMVDMGLKGMDFDYCTTPESCDPHIDNREATHDELARQVADMVATATRIKLKYEEVAKRGNNPNGGTAIYLPVAIALSNFGWTIIADKRTYVIQ